MSDAPTRRLLIVANRTESTPRLLEEVEQRARVIPPDPSGWSYAHGFPDEWVRTEVGPLT